MPEGCVISSQTRSEKLLRKTLPMCSTCESREEEDEEEEEIKSCSYRCT